MADSVDGARAELHARVSARRREIEAALAARVFGIATPAETVDPAYRDGLRTALSAALDYAFVALQVGERRAGAVPTPLTAQARMAARNGVGLDTVLRRYVAGYSIFTQFVIEEAENGGLHLDLALQRILHGYAAVFDRLITAVSEEHTREAVGRLSTLGERRADRVRRLLDGEPIDGSDLEHDFEACNLALIASGPAAAEALRGLAGAAGKPLLLVLPERGFAWGWLASSSGFDQVLLEDLARRRPSLECALAIGEPAPGLDGWRLSHRQALSAHSVAIRAPGGPVRYRDVALLAAMLRDDLLIDSLRRTFIEPLDRHRDGREALHEAMDAYFASGRNISSASAALRLDRRTLSRRLQTIERLLGRQLDHVAMELEAVLRLSRLNVV